MGHALLSKYKSKQVYYTLDLGVYLQRIANIIHFSQR